MSIETLKRVMWRLRKRHPNERYVTNDELRKCVELECGTSPSTYFTNRAVMIRQKYIKSRGSKRIEILTGDIDDS